ncbi:hypothetical protein DSO57_1010490 [Entomophthora muscae]|uniref:Uncharacterized protein n=1 Tax=Entomophthora muscae TaxID=34485 RepID=A0ACC2SJB1_9FUNG|nr:hypothetical protein DSO57_1010490 [Entomophthora muscae]
MSTEPINKTPRKGYSIEESTWDLLSNLVHAKKSFQLYLDKKNLKKGLLGEEGDVIRIDNSFPLKTQDQERNLNPDPENLWASSPEEQGATCLRFLGIKPPQAEAKNDYSKGKASQTKEITAPN